MSSNPKHPSLTGYAIRGLVDLLRIDGATYGGDVSKKLVKAQADMAALRKATLQKPPRRPEDWMVFYQVYSDIEDKVAQVLALEIERDRRIRSTLNRIGDILDQNGIDGLEDPLASIDLLITMLQGMLDGNG